MIDMLKHKYHEEDYQEFIHYVKSTWKSLFEWTFVCKVKIKKIIIHNCKNNFDVFVIIDDNVYENIIEGELVGIPYDGKAIKTSYSLSSDELLYVLIKGTLLEDLNLSDVEFVVTEFIDGISVNEYLTERLEGCEEDYAEDYYCRKHDL